MKNAFYKLIIFYLDNFSNFLNDFSHLIWDPCFVASVDLSLLYCSITRLQLAP